MESFIYDGVHIIVCRETCLDFPLGMFFALLYTLFFKGKKVVMYGVKRDGPVNSAAVGGFCRSSFFYPTKQ